jgi:hypothetical protein
MKRKMIMKTIKWIFAALIAGSLAIAAQAPVLVSTRPGPASPTLTGDDRTDPAPAPMPTPAPQAVAVPAPPASTWLSEQLPSWLYVGGQVRARGEGFSGSSLVPGRDYQDAMTRIRLDLGIKFTSWLRVFGEGQDARVFNYFTRPDPTNAEDTADLRQAYVELGNLQDLHWAARVGRQELAFGEERLIGVADWTNVTKFFDAARLTYSSSYANLDVFSASIVNPVIGAMDHHLDGNNLHGFYGSFKKWIPRAVVEPYAFWRTDPNNAVKIGPKGHLDEYTYGARVAGKFGGKFERFDYSAEGAGQTGSLGSDTIDAKFAHSAIGYTIHQGARPIRLAAQYNYASGDPNASSYRIEGFDQLYPSNHNKFGFADLFGDKNLKNTQVSAEWKATRKLSLTTQFGDDRLATIGDSVYNGSGTALFHNYKATSNNMGEEIDIFAQYTVAKSLGVGAGYAHLFRGEYLVELSKGNASYSFLTWTYRF